MTDPAIELVVRALDSPMDSAEAAAALRAAGARILPGLIDLHGHVVPEVLTACVDAGVGCPPDGVTTIVDAGTTGWRTVDALIRATRTSRVRILGWLNIGPFGLGPRQSGQPELTGIIEADADRTAEAIELHRDVLVGVKVRATPRAIDPAKTEFAIALAAKAARATKTPLMVHVAGSPVSLCSLLSHLAPGDVVTHAFHGGPNGLLRPDGSVHPDAHAAQASGVIFDVGHAGEHFDASVAQQAVDDGFLPDTVSTDVHWLPGSNVPSMAEIINQFLSFGVPLEHLVRGSTEVPARVIGRPALADLARDSVSDVTVVALADNTLRVLATVHGGGIVYGQEWLASVLLAPQR